MGGSPKNEVPGGGGTWIVGKGIPHLTSPHFYLAYDFDQGFRTVGIDLEAQGKDGGEVSASLTIQMKPWGTTLSPPERSISLHL